MEKTFNFKAFNFSPIFWWKTIEKSIELTDIFGKEIEPDFNFIKWFNRENIENDSIELVKDVSSSLNNEKYYNASRNEYFHKIIGDSTLIFTLKKLTIGSKLKFEHISFIGNQATILPASEGDLKLLTSFLQENPHINVEIGGHVNGKGRNKRKFKKLSKERAKAIVDYLVNKNIKPTQLTYVGYCNSKINYKNPYTEKESTANRRVEVIVISIQ